MDYEAIEYKNILKKYFPFILKVSKNKKVKIYVTA